MPQRIRRNQLFPPRIHSGRSLSKYTFWGNQGRCPRNHDGIFLLGSNRDRSHCSAHKKTHRLQHKRRGTQARLSERRQLYGREEARRSLILLILKENSFFCTPEAARISVTSQCEHLFYSFLSFCGVGLHMHKNPPPFLEVVWDYTAPVSILGLRSTFNRVIQTRSLGL